MKRLITTVFLVTLNSSWASSKLTFHQSHTRYVGGHDLIRLLQQKFLNVDWRTGVPQCAFLSDDNRAALGESNPSNGEVTYPAPSTAFVRLYTRCLRAGIDLQFPTAPENDRPWSGVNPEDHRRKVRELVHQYIGPGIHSKESEFVEKLLVSAGQNPGTLNGLKKTILMIALDEAFFTY